MTTRIRQGNFPATVSGAALDQRELVALSFSKGDELVGRLLEAWAQNLAVLPLDARLPRAALEQTLGSLRPSRLLSDSGEWKLDGLPVGGRTALVMVTSGTSGYPKGVELSHEALDWAAQGSVAALGDAGEGRWLCCLPLHHIAGLMVVLRARVKGALPLIHDRFDEQAIAREKGAALISLVPSTLHKLLEAGADLSRFSAILLGGGPVPQELLTRAAENKAKILTTYGMTETCGGCVLDGLPLEGVRVKVQKEQILLAGPMLFSRYRLQPALTRRALREGWFHTSDRGRISSEGRLRVLGRLDDVINTGGEKVSAGEVERVLREHPHVEDAVVVGIPSERWGQEVAAAIVVRPEVTLRLEDIKAFVRERRTSVMAPKKILCVPSIPRSAAGKVAAPDLRRLQERLQRSTEQDD